MTRAEREATVKPLKRGARLKSAKKWKGGDWHHVSALSNTGQLISTSEHPTAVYRLYAAEFSMG